MKERPILFSGPMVRALLEGRKTQTRRLVKPRHLRTSEPVESVLGSLSGALLRDAAAYCPYGRPGDRLWVKETHLNNALAGYPPAWFYRADGDDKPDDRHWKPSIFCTRAASRISLEVTEVRVERLNAISEADAQAEGGPAVLGYFGKDWQGGHKTYRQWFQSLWESINGDGSWKLNSWVWVIEFRKVAP